MFQIQKIAQIALSCCKMSMCGSDTNDTGGGDMFLTEDKVRDKAGKILGFNDSDDVVSGVGQLTTFNQLGNSLGISTFKRISDKPDGWYLPRDFSAPAIILETKNSKEDISASKWIDEIKKNIEHAQKKYKKVTGILYNGEDIKVFKGLEEVIAASELQPKEYYLAMWNDEKIDKQEIYRLTKQINDCLHTEFGVKNLYHRMIFTACALVAIRYGALVQKGMSYSLFKQSILEKLDDTLEDSLTQNKKLKSLSTVYSTIEMNITENQEAIDNFIDWVTQISDKVNSDNWNGEDVMGIFFNEFNRYKKKSESGQVFTPDNITSFMCRLIEVGKDDKVLDAACGSGAFLVKAMSNMIQQAGGVRAKKAASIKQKQLFGIEFDKEIYALACANMLIHKDGKTNIMQLDSRYEEASNWIAEKGITKVLMNPPFERKYGCMKIVSNVLDHVPAGIKAAFILPDKKLEKDFADKTYGNKVLKNHTLTTIIKLPENTFNAGVTTSIFVFETGKPQNGKNIIGYYIEDDGLVTVKNQGRQDIKDKWHEIEDYWITAIHDGVDEKYNTRQIINPAEHLSYQMPEKEFEICEEDFAKTVMDYLMFQRGIDVKDFSEKLVNKVLYSSSVKGKKSSVNIEIAEDSSDNEM